jgi:hypothetical protein
MKGQLALQKMLRDYFLKAEWNNDLSVAIDKIDERMNASIYISNSKTFIPYIFFREPTL